MTARTFPGRIPKRTLRGSARKKARSSFFASKRFIFTWFMLAVTFIFTIGRLTYIQGVDSSHYASLAGLSQTVSLPALRGSIYGRNGGVIAMSVPEPELIADPYRIHNPAMQAAILAPILGSTVASLDSKLSEPTGFVPLAFGLSASVVNKITTLIEQRAVHGLVIEEQQKRVYPASNLDLAIIGSTNIYNQGISGLEYQYNNVLSGKNGEAQVQQSPYGLELPGGYKIIRPAVAGSSIMLTIDTPLQYIVQDYVSQELVLSKAKAGVAVVMNVHTGAILAMVNMEAGANNTAVVDPTNLALQTVYEPGSVMKITTFSAALMNRLITPTTVFRVPWSLNIDGSIFSDAWYHPTENMTATHILSHSSNIGTITIAKLLGKDRVAQWLSAYGFGQPTGLNFPSESSGFFPSPSNWSPTAIGSMPIGQDEAVTVQQVVDAFAALSNGGVFVHPRLVRAIIGPNGHVHRLSPLPSRRLVSPTVATELMQMFEHVVFDGTGVGAAVAGYLVGGKTGTSQQPWANKPGYQPGNFDATFVGFAPAQAPQLAAVVMFEHPTPIYGGSVSAPVFAKIMSYALKLYNIPPPPIPAGTYIPTTPNLPVSVMASH